MKNPMSRLRPLPLATMLLCVTQFGRAFAAELHVPVQYPTIQQAVDAAVSGDTVRIAAGDYTEQVVVAFKTGLTLAGGPGTVLHASPGMRATLAAYGWSHYPVCAIYRSDVVVSGLHFEGGSLGGSFPVTLDGLLLLGGGGVVTNCTFSDFRAVGTGSSSAARAVYCYNWVNTGTGLVSVTFTGNTFTNNITALRLAGDPNSANPGQLRLTVRVHGNTIIGFGPYPGWNAGIFLNCGVTGDVTENFVSDFVATGSVIAPAVVAYDGSVSIHGRWVPLQPLNFDGNTLTNNGHIMILIGANGSRIVNNKFTVAVPGVDSWGGLQVSGTNVQVANNNFADMPIGTVLLNGTESWVPSIPPAANISLIGNWFCNVPEPILVKSQVTVLQEHGSETNFPFAPRFQSITSSNGVTQALLRGWHGDSYVIETSTNFQHWAPVHTNRMTLPLFELEHTNTPVGPHRFYRALKQ